MKKQVVFILFSCVLIIGSGCKSSFEKIRASGDTELIYKKAFEYFEQEEYQRSQTLFELIIPAYRGKAELEDIYYTYAYTYYHLERFILANYYFKNFTTTFPNSDKRQEASFMAAYSNYELSPVYRLDQTYTNKAIDEFQIFVNTYPQSEKVAECNRLIDQMRLKLEKKSFEEAKLYFDLRQYQAATATFENLLKDFPETTKAEQVRYMMAKSAYLLAQNSIYEKQEERYKQVVAYSNDFLKKFKSSDNLGEVKSFYFNSIKRLKELTNGRYQDQSTGTGS